MQGECLICPASHTSKWQSQDSNSGLWSTPFGHTPEVYGLKQYGLFP